MYDSLFRLLRIFDMTYEIMGEGMEVCMLDLVYLIFVNGGV